MSTPGGSPASTGLSARGVHCCGTPAGRNDHLDRGVEDRGGVGGGGGDNMLHTGCLLRISVRVL